MKAEQEGKSASFWMEEKIFEHIYPATQRGRYGARLAYVQPKKKAVA